jgi:hypothetical protein
LAGCFGWLVRDDAMVARLQRASSELSSQAGGTGTSAPSPPAWYEIWSSNKLEGSRLQRAVELFGRVTHSPPAPIDWVRFHTAASICLRHQCALSVEFMPAGRVERGEWIVGPYCPRCRSPMDASLRHCVHCGHQGGPHPARRRKVIGRRPFRKLESLVGAARAAELVTRLQPAIARQTRSGNA